MGLLTLFLFAFALIVAGGTLALIHLMERPARHSYAAALARHEPTDPREMGYIGEERMFTFDDGATSPGWIVKGEREDGPTIIISHGLADSRFGALKRLPMVLPLASRVVLYDLRGHGDSTAKKTTLTAKEPDDLERIMNEIDDGSPFVLMGHSMGAGVSMIVAARESKREDGGPSRVTAVICEGGYRWPMETIIGYLRMHRWPAQPFVWLAAMHLGFWLGITNHSFDRVRIARQIDCPLLMINGDADLVSPLTSAREVVEAAPQGKFVIIANGGHGDLPVRFQSEFGRAIRSFLETLP